MPLGVDADATLGSAEGDTHHSAFERHECRERHGFVLCNVQGVTNAAFGRQQMVAMLGAIRLDYVDLPVVELDRETHSIHTIAGSNLVQQPRSVGRECSCVIELGLHVTEKTSVRHYSYLPQCSATRSNFVGLDDYQQPLTKRYIGIAVLPHSTVFGYENCE